MLAKTNRVRTKPEFSAVMKRGVRQSLGSSLSLMVLETGEVRPGRLGLVISTKVGNAVTRHALARKLRHQMRPWLADEKLSSGLSIVLLARPGAGALSSAQIERELEILPKVITRARGRARGRTRS